MYNEMLLVIFALHDSQMKQHYSYGKTSCLHTFDADWSLHLN